MSYNNNVVVTVDTAYDRIVATTSVVYVSVIRIRAVPNDKRTFSHKCDYKIEQQ